MRIESASMDASNTPPRQQISSPSAYNTALLKIQHHIESQPEMAVESRQEINKTLRTSINELNNIYHKKIEKDINSSATEMKTLQILRIKYSLTAIKCGDTDWETFQESEFLHLDSDDFINSHHCTLTLEEQKIQRIDAALRNAVWLSCLYNFSRELVYGNVDAPQNKENKLFYNVFTCLINNGVPTNLAGVIANTQAALTLCQLSFGEEPEPQDTLYCGLTEVVEFYDNYLQARQEGKEVCFLMQNPYFKSEQTLIPADVKHDIALGYYEQVTDYL